MFTPSSVVSSTIRANARSLYGTGHHHMPVVAVLQSFLLVLGSALNPGALVVSAVYLATVVGVYLVINGTLGLASN